MPADPATEESFRREVARWEMELECVKDKGADYGRFRVVIFKCPQPEVILFREVDGAWHGYQAVYPDPEVPALHI